MSLTPVIAVVTAQVRLTVPLNPFVSTTLIVPVFPVVAPGVSVMEVVPPVPAVKLCSAVMFSAMLVFAVNVPPEVPVMVTVTGAVVTVAEVAAVRVSTWVPAVEPAKKEAVTPLGKPLAERVIVPEKPPTSVGEIVVVPLPPWATDTVVGEADNVKPGATFTVTDPLPVALLYVDELTESGAYAAVNVSLPTASDPAEILIVALPLLRVAAAEV